MKNYIWICMVFGALNMQGQQITFDTQRTFQTMHSFGASDCWSLAMVGKHYPENKKKQIAEWLFSLESDALGNPKGIGLSMWRFNIGAGSTEQGNASKISNEWRRAESFLTGDAYDWEKQKGQQWLGDRKWKIRRMELQQVENRCLDVIYNNRFHPFSIHLFESI